LPVELVAVLDEAEGTIGFHASFACGITQRPAVGDELQEPGGAAARLERVRTTRWLPQHAPPNATIPV